MFGVEIWYKDFTEDRRMKFFYISINFIFVFRVNILQQLHLPVNSILCKQEKKPSKTFESI